VVLHEFRYSQTYSLSVFWPCGFYQFFKSIVFRHDSPTATLQAREPDRSFADSDACGEASPASDCWAACSGSQVTTSKCREMSNPASSGRAAALTRLSYTVVVCSSLYQSKPPNGNNHPRAFERGECLETVERLGRRACLGAERVGCIKGWAASLDLIPVATIETLHSKPHLHFVSHHAWEDQVTVSLHSGQATV